MQMFQNSEPKIKAVASATETVDFGCGQETTAFALAPAAASIMAAE